MPVERGGCGDTGILDGVRIVAFCHFLQGPAAAQYLADVGADVIRVEPLGGAADRFAMGGGRGPDGSGSLFLAGNRNMRSIAVDLKSPEGKQIAEQMAQRADVVMENYRPGVMDRLGLGYKDLRRGRDDLIYASASGFGSSGPLADAPGQDLLAQSLSGLAWASARRAIPPSSTGAAIIDQHGAALLAMGICAAMVKRERTGLGTRIESNLLNAALDLQQEAITFFLNRESGATSDELRDRPSQLATWYHPGAYGIYGTNDERHIAISITSQEKLLAAFDDLQVPTDDAEDDRIRRNRFAEALEASIASRDVVQVQSSLLAAGVWCAPVLNYEEMIAHPQVVENGMVVRLEASYGEIALVCHPLEYDGKRPSVVSAPPSCGEHTNGVLAELGYSRQEIAALLNGVVRSS